MLRLLIPAAVAMSLCVPAVAQPTIDVGVIQLQPDTPNQTVQVDVTGGQAVNSVRVGAQIGDGLGAAGPTFQSVDILTGTIFADDNFGQTQVVTDGYVSASTLSFSDVSASGLLATFTVDTTGVTDGSYEFRLDNTIADDTVFNQGAIVPVVANGTLLVVPEPASGVVALAILGLVIVPKRVRRPQC
jgi:hypothetical protein